MIEIFSTRRHSCPICVMLIDIAHAQTSAKEILKNVLNWWRVLYNDLATGEFVDIFYCCADVIGLEKWKN